MAHLFHIMRPPIPWKRGPVVSEDAGCVSHVYWRNGGIQDSKGLTWTMGGTVPQVVASGKTPPGAGPFSVGNFYFSGTGNDALDFTGDFFVVAVFNPATNHNGTLVSDGVAGTAGWIAQITSNPFGRIDAYRAGGSDNVTTQTYGYVTGAPNVLCCGRAGSNLVVKVNLGTYRSGAAGTITPGTSQRLEIGRYGGGANGLNGTIYEVLASTSTPSDDLFVSIASQVKSRMGITAW